MFDVQQSDVNLLFQKQKEHYVKMELLNKNFQPIDLLEGEAIDGSIKISADSDIRRTCDITFVVKNKTYLASETSKIWFDKFIRVSVGVKGIRNTDIVWYPCGILLFNESSYTFNETTNTVSVKCLDMTSLLTGTRNGSHGALTTTIPAGSNIRNAMISQVTQLGGITKYRIDNIGGSESIYENELAADPYQVPYDLKFSAGCNVYQIITTLRDLYPGWESFFDTDGTFICQKVPTKFEEPVVLDSSIMNQLIISESSTISFENVKNVTEVWGKVVEVDNYSESPTLSGTTYQVTFETFEAYSTGAILGLKITGSNPAGAGIQINALGVIPIVDSDGNAIKANEFGDNVYTFKYQNQKFYFLGQFQVQGIVMEYSREPTEQEKADNISKYGTDKIEYVINPASQFGVDKISAILNVCSGDQYSKIYSDALALERASYENWKTTRLMDSVSLEMIAVPWLSVNQKVEFTSNITGETNQYIVKDISFPVVGGTMQVQLIRYYPLYPDSWTLEMVSVENMNNGSGDWGLRLKIGFNHQARFISDNLNCFTLSDSEGTSFAASQYISGENTNTVIIEFADFNSAVGECSLKYTPGTIAGEMGILGSATVKFSPRNLVPYVPPDTTGYLPMATYKDNVSTFALSGTLPMDTCCGGVTALRQVNGGTSAFEFTGYTIYGGAI